VIEPRARGEARSPIAGERRCQGSGKAGFSHHLGRARAGPCRRRRGRAHSACTAGDDGSGLADGADASFSLTTAVAEGTETADAATDSRQVCDLARNCATAGPFTGIAVDRRAPQITISSPADGQVAIVGDTLTAAYACDDAGSGVAACAGPVASGESFTVDAAGEVHDSHSPSTEFAQDFITSELPLEMVTF